MKNPLLVLAVFGVVYAQAEDDFNRVETNYLNAMGRLAEGEGEAEIFRDLRMKIFIDPDDMKAQYQASPEWLKALMNGWAAGLNYYLQKHPSVTPRVIKRFEPWMALTFSEGSIGGDIERVNLDQLEAFYGPRKEASATGRLKSDTAGDSYVEPTGSNGIAIAPSNTTAHHALLLINPHTSFFFRAEAQMASDEGLNAYGALTWGQFFIYRTTRSSRMRMAPLRISIRTSSRDAIRRSIGPRPWTAAIPPRNGRDYCPRTKHRVC